MVCRASALGFPAVAPKHNYNRSTAIVPSTRVLLSGCGFRSFRVSHLQEEEHVAFFALFSLLLLS